jgi:hypothetical protein
MALLGSSLALLGSSLELPGSSLELPGSSLELPGQVRERRKADFMPPYMVFGWVNAVRNGISGH